MDAGLRRHDVWGFFFSKTNLFLFLAFLPSLTFAHSRHFEETQLELRAARERAGLHHLEVMAARRRAAAEAMRAAVLAQAQVAAAAQVRGLEDQTAQAASALDDLAARGQAAAAALRQNEAA